MRKLILTVLAAVYCAVLPGVAGATGTPGGLLPNELLAASTMLVLVGWGCSIAPYSWTFGDRGDGVGVTPNHTYGGAGTRTVELTVTDNEGASSSTSRQVTVSSAAVGSAAAVSNNAGTANQRVTIPASVQAGDVIARSFAANAASNVSRMVMFT